MKTHNPFFGVLGEERYRLYRESILEALAQKDLGQKELSLALGLSYTAVSVAMIQKGSRSKLYRALVDLENEGLINTYYMGKRKLYSRPKVAPPEEQPKQSGTASEYFELFRKALSAEADKKAAEFYKGVIDNLREQIKNLEEAHAKLQEKVAIRRAVIVREKGEITQMCSKCAAKEYPGIDWRRLNGLKVDESICPSCNCYSALIPVSDLEFAYGIPNV